MKETLGDSEAVNGSSIEEVVKKIRADAAYIPEQQLLAERTKNQELEIQVRQYEREQIEKRVKVNKVIRNVTSRIFNLLFVLSLLLLVGSIIIPFFPNVPLFWRISCILAAVFFGVYSVGYGFNLRGWKDNVTDMTSEKIMMFLEKRFFSAAAETPKSKS